MVKLMGLKINPLKYKIQLIIIINIYAFVYAYTTLTS